jgi:streptogramin lyase
MASSAATAAAIAAATASGDGSVLHTGTRDFAEAAGPVAVGGGPVPPEELGGGPARAAVGAGQVWVTTRLGARGIDVATLRAGPSLRLGHRAEDVAAAGGKVWVIDRPRDRLLRLDSRTGRQSGRPLRFRHPARVAAGDGWLWVASGAGRVVRVDPRSGRAVGRAMSVPRSAWPVGLAVGAGSVWLAGDNGILVRLDPRTGRVVRRFALGSSLGSIAVDEHAVWVAMGTEGDGVARIDPRTGRRSATHLLDSSYPDGVAVGDGAVWVASSNRGTITRLDPETGRAIGDPLVLGDVGDGIAFGGGALWVPHGADASVSVVRRTDPTPVSRTGGGAIDELAGTYKGVGIGDSPAHVRGKLGRPGHWSPREAIVPLDVDFLAVSYGASFSHDVMRIAQPGGQVLRYGDVFFYLCAPRTRCRGMVGGFEVFAPGARTSAGVGIGDSLRTARARYRLTCYTPSGRSEHADYPSCQGSVARDRYVYFSNDPIDDIEVAYAPFR